MKRRQILHEYQTRNQKELKKIKKENIYRFTSFEDLSTIENLYWNEMSRRSKKRKPLTYRNAKFNRPFRSGKKKLRYLAQNAWQSQNRRKLADQESSGSSRLSMLAVRKGLIRDIEDYGSK